MAIQGLRDVSGFTVTGQRPENWREGILLLFPNGDTPLTALTSVMRSESTDDPKYHWFEKIMSDQRIAMAEDFDTTELDITVGSAAIATEVRKDHMLLVEQTGEVLRVTSVAGAVINVARAQGEAGTNAGTAGGVGAATVLFATQNPWLTIIGTAHEEGSAKPAGVAYDPTEKFNYTQIFRNSLEATRTAINTRLRTGDAIREAKREALQYHAIEMERAFWFGGRIQTTGTGSRPLRTTEGFLTFMQREAPTRIVSVPTVGALMLKTLEGYLKDIFDYGSSEKVAFMGNRAILAIQQCLRLNSQTPYTISQGQKEFGMAVTRLTSPFGELVLKTHPLFNRMTSVAANSAADSWMFVLDMDEVKYRYLRNSDTQYTTNMQVPGDDQQVAGYLTECGLEYHHARTHFIVKNIMSGAVDV